MKVLLLGGTGAIGVHLASFLEKRGEEVSVTSRSGHSDHGKIKYIKGDAGSVDFLRHVLSEKYDTVVDFIIRSPFEFSELAETVLPSVGQYVFISSYRVHADTPVLTEESPRLLDVCNDQAYLSTDEYALAKARCEDVLTKGAWNNWTIVRPGITYDGSGRFQLGTLEAGTWLLRALRGLDVMFPQEMLDKVTTLSWGGDVARMIAGLIGNPVAFGEIYLAATSEHLTWGEVADLYRKETGLNLFLCDVDSYEKAVGGHYQIWCDRMYDRRISNKKIMTTCNLSQKEITPIRERLVSELSCFLSSGKTLRGDISPNARMDKALGGFGSFAPLRKSRCGFDVAAKYLIRRLF